MPEPGAFPADFPDYLRHRDEETPVPTWEQVTRSTASPNAEMIAHLTRLLSTPATAPSTAAPTAETGGATDETEATDEAKARARWDGLPPNYQRSVALLVDKIYHEGWLDHVGQIKDWPWDGGFFFYPRDGDSAALAYLLDAKSASDDDPYIQCRFGKGLFAYLNIRNHRGWARGWMETDAALAALHVGLFKDGLAEVHFDAFNALYLVGAPDDDVTRLPLIGAYNHAMFKLHKKYELESEYVQLTRTSANFYHMMRDEVPLSF